MSVSQTVWDGEAKSCRYVTIKAETELSGPVEIFRLSQSVSAIKLVQEPSAMIWDPAITHAWEVINRGRPAAGDESRYLCNEVVTSRRT